MGYVLGIGKGIGVMLADGIFEQATLYVKFLTFLLCAVSEHTLSLEVASADSFRAFHWVQGVAEYVIVERKFEVICNHTIL